MREEQVVKVMVQRNGRTIQEIIDTFTQADFDAHEASRGQPISVVARAKYLAQLNDAIRSEDPEVRELALVKAERLIGFKIIQ